jgi:hypothetical protein
MAHTVATVVDFRRGKQKAEPANNSGRQRQRLRSYRSTSFTTSSASSSTCGVEDRTVRGSRLRKLCYYLLLN